VIDGVRARRGQWLTLLTLTGLVAGMAIIITAVATQRHASQPSPGAWGTVSGITSAPTASATSRTSGAENPAGKHNRSVTPSSAAKHQQDKPSPHGDKESKPLALPPSKPVKVNIPAIKVNSPVFAIGKDDHGGLQVPQPGPNLNHVAWYRGSPTPGQTGPSVLEGHVDTIHGPSVFLRLGALVPGDKIIIGRADGTTAVFTVNAVRDYKSHSNFPTDLVYGGDLSSATLRIITCSNFDGAIGHYVGNTIVFAHLTTLDR